jgi:1-acyl-sn-glycerol-3-phosphate acyltransferase
MPSALLVAVRTVVALICLSVYILVLGPPLLLWAALTRNLGPLYSAGYGSLWIGMALLGIRVRVLGREHIQQSQAAVYAANHNSNIDPPVVFRALSALFSRLKVIYKAELRRLPLLVWVFDTAGFVPVERANREQSLPALDRAIASLGAGNSFVIFPEGTRSPTTSLLPFKKGGFVMAIRAQVPIVPVAVSGGLQAMRKGSRLIWPTTLTVAFAPPVPTRGLTAADRDAVIAKVRAAIDDRIQRTDASVPAPADAAPR